MKIYATEFECLPDSTLEPHLRKAMQAAEIPVNCVISVGKRDNRAPESNKKESWVIFWSK